MKKLTIALLSIGVMVGSAKATPLIKRPYSHLLQDNSGSVELCGPGCHEVRAANERQAARTQKIENARHKVLDFITDDAASKLSRYVMDEINPKHGTTYLDKKEAFEAVMALVPDHKHEELQQLLDKYVALSQPPHWGLLSPAPVHSVFRKPISISKQMSK